MGNSEKKEQEPTERSKNGRQATGQEGKGVGVFNTAKRLVLRLAARCRDPGVLNPATAAASARSSRCPTLGEEGSEEE